MKIVFEILVLVYLQDIVVGDLRVGSCGRTEYYIEKTSCDAQFVISMNESSNAFTECPTFYVEAHDCFKMKILDHCFEEYDPTKLEKAVQFLEEEFGDENHFCVEGLLMSMKSVMESSDISTCGELNPLDYVEFEGKFHDAFREEFKKPVVNFTRLQREYYLAKLDQSLLARACNLDYSTNSHHFFDAAEFNPFDAESLKKVKELADKIEHGEEVEEPDTTALTVVLVFLVIVILVAAALFYLWRRDKSRAEIRRQKRESRKSQKNGETEMQSLSGGAVVQTSDEVASG